MKDEVDVVSDIKDTQLKEDDSSKSIIVTELLQKHNQLIELNNNILTETKQYEKRNFIVNFSFKAMLTLVSIGVLYILFKISVYIEVNNNKETNITYQAPKQDVPVVNVNPSKIQVQKDITDKIAFSSTDYRNWTYQNTSNNTIFCKTANYVDYDVVFAPYRRIKLMGKIHSCKDAHLLEVENEKNLPTFK